MRVNRRQSAGRLVALLLVLGSCVADEPVREPVEFRLSGLPYRDFVDENDDGLPGQPLPDFDRLDATK